MASSFGREMLLAGGTGAKSVDSGMADTYRLGDGGTAASGPARGYLQRERERGRKVSKKELGMSQGKRESRCWFASWKGCCSVVEIPG